MPTTTWRVATRAGHRLHVRDHAPDDPGDGPPLLLVHGLASNARLWDGLADELVAAGHRAVAVDQRGHGHSEQAADGPDPDGVLRDLVDVCDTLGLVRPVAVGQSWGGNVVLELAADHGGRLRSVACIDGGHIDLVTRFDGDHAAMREALEPPPFDDVTLEEVTARMAAVTADWPDQASAGQLANLVVRPDGTVEPALRRPEHHAILEAMWSRSPLETAARVEVPVLLLPATGAATPGEEETGPVDALAARLRHCTVHWATGAHHDVHAQRPDEVARVLLDALATGAL